MEGGPVEGYSVDIRVSCASAASPSAGPASRPDSSPTCRRALDETELYAPEPGGLTARQLLDAVRRIAVELPVVGMDVVEVSPPYDHAELTSFLANRVVLEALSGMARRCRGDPWDPAQQLLEGR